MRSRPRRSSLPSSVPGAFDTSRLRLPPPTTHPPHHPPRRVGADTALCVSGGRCIVFRSLFARTEPKHKSDLVRLLQSQGEICAMVRLLLTRGGHL